MLSMRDLSRVYRTETVETCALDGVDLEIEDGEFVGDHGAVGLRQVDPAQRHRDAR